MTDSLRKAPRSAYKPRSLAWVGNGSHQTYQRVVGPSMRSVQTTKRTYGFCTTSRGMHSVSSWQACQPICASMCACDTVRVDGRVKSDLSPSPLPVAMRGPLPIFPPFFNPRAFVRQSTKRSI